MIREKKIDAMHRVYGCFDGAKCKNCPHLDAYANYDETRYWYKCHMYGVTSGPGTDWRVGYDACGAFLIDPEEAKERGLYGDVYRQTRGVRKESVIREEIPGQIKMAI